MMAKGRCFYDINNFGQIDHFQAISTTVILAHHLIFFSLSAVGFESYLAAPSQGRG